MPSSCAWSSLPYFVCPVACCCCDSLSIFLVLALLLNWSLLCPFLSAALYLISRHSSPVSHPRPQSSTITTVPALPALIILFFSPATPLLLMLALVEQIAKVDQYNVKMLVDPSKTRLATSAERDEALSAAMAAWKMRSEEAESLALDYFQDKGVCVVCSDKDKWMDHPIRCGVCHRHYHTHCLSAASALCPVCDDCCEDDEDAVADVLQDLIRSTRAARVVAVRVAQEAAHAPQAHVQHVPCFPASEILLR